MNFGKEHFTNRGGGGGGGEAYSKESLFEKYVFRGYQIEGLKRVR